MPEAPVLIDPAETDAVVFDMDGVITDTVPLHRAAWKQLFDTYLRERVERGDDPAPFREFTEADYLRYVDGKPRYDGVDSFLRSRGIALTWGRPGDPPELETVCGLGNRKNAAFKDRLDAEGCDPYPSSVALLDQLEAAGIPVAVISASRNAPEVLTAAGVIDRFGARVDGVVAAELGLAGKPDPAVFLEAVRRLGVPPERAIVVEDAQAGVEAGRRGGFGRVIGVNRGGEDQRRDLAAFADVVVDDLAEVAVRGADAATGSGRPALRDLPPLDHDDLRDRLGGREPAVFLDYDGTLTPIVDDPADATLSPGGRAAIGRLRDRCTVAIVSGRDLDDVRAMVGIDDLWYAGSHGFDILAPDGSRHQKGTEYLPALDAAEAELGRRLDGVPGARIERKRFAIAVHHRQTPDDRVGDVEAVVNEVAAAAGDLRVTGGKRIFELRPDLDWHKGRALSFLLEELDLDRPDVVPIYVGDDVTDEDAFAELDGRGIGVVVRGEDDDRPTSADVRLEDTDEAHRLLDVLASLLE